MEDAIFVIAIVLALGLFFKDMSGSYELGLIKKELVRMNELLEMHLKVLEKRNKEV